MSRIVLFNKPFSVLSQFRAADGRRGLGDYLEMPGVYAAGRLDADSEGLLVLTDDGRLQQRLTDPRHKLPKTYLVQVEGVADAASLQQLRTGVILDGRPTRPALVESVAEPPDLWPRHPPIRVRRAIPTAWLEVTLTEGRNRQVRRMTAAVGLPTLRLVRWRIGPWTVAGLAPGEWRETAGSEAGETP